MSAIKPSFAVKIIRKVPVVVVVPPTAFTIYEPMTVFNGGNPEILFNLEGDIIMSAREYLIPA